MKKIRAKPVGENNRKTMYLTKVGTGPSTINGVLYVRKIKKIYPKIQMVWI
jgi:hypothetical protein